MSKKKRWARLKIQLVCQVDRIKLVEPVGSIKNVKKV